MQASGEQCEFDGLPDCVNCGHPAASHDEEFGNCGHLGVTDTGWDVCECPGYADSVDGAISLWSEEFLEATNGER